MVESFPLSLGVDIRELRRHPEEWWQANVDRIIDDPNSARFLAWVYSRVIGMVGVKVVNSIPETGSMYVKPDHQGAGIGNRLIDEALNFAKSRGATNHTLWAHKSNSAAIRLYESVGFRATTPTVTKERFDGHGEEFQMVKVND